MLKGVDDIVVQLDDHMMSLQTMGSSRYVSAFAMDVQQWERKLSHVAEVCEVWLAVQCRWVYLESIFVGSQGYSHAAPTRSAAV